MPKRQIHPVFKRHRAQWDYDSVRLRLRSREELNVLDYMVGFGREPLPKYASWSEGQVLARIRNLVEQRRRRSDHMTGAE